MGHILSFLAELFRRGAEQFAAGLVGLGISSTLKTKKSAREAIHRRITERKESVQRTQF